MRGWRRGVAAIAVLALVPGCYGIRVGQQNTPRAEYTHLERPKVAPDDLQISGLRRAAQASRRYFATKKSSQLHALGGDVYSSQQIGHSVDHFLRILEETPPRQARRDNPHDSEKVPHRVPTTICERARHGTIHP